ncbi:MAG TPA: dienelactone hydrolase family protein [Acidimicrobiia bacterium]|nr:dienelactone hydrolase family protein [Acidimicrobiia bacterium]
MAALREGPVHDIDVGAAPLVVDGLEIPALHARPDGLPLAGVVLHPDVGGLRPLFEDMARRLATHGLAVCVMEPFAGQPLDVRATTESRLAAVRDLDDSQQMDMLGAAADLLVVSDDVSRVSVLGFCMGGHYAFKAAATDRFDAAVSFYGMLRTPDAWKGPGHRIEPLAVAAEMAPTLAFFGSNDPWTPPADISELRGAWSRRDDCKIVVVEGAEHGFVHDPDRDVHRPDESAEAWEATLKWLGAS